MTTMTTATLADDLRAMAARLDAQPEPLVIGGDGDILGAIRVLGQIAPHLGGVYAINVAEGEVRLQGNAAEVGHVATTLGLSHDEASDHTSANDSHVYQIWTGTFDKVTVNLVAVRRVKKVA